MSNIQTEMRTLTVPLYITSINPAPSELQKLAIGYLTSLGEVDLPARIIHDITTYTLRGLVDVEVAIDESLDNVTIKYPRCVGDAVERITSIYVRLRLHYSYLNMPSLLGNDVKVRTCKETLPKPKGVSGLDNLYDRLDLTGNISYDPPVTVDLALRRDTTWCCDKMATDIAEYKTRINKVTYGWLLSADDLDPTTEMLPDFKIVSIDQILGKVRIAMRQGMPLPETAICFTLITSDKWVTDRTDVMAGTASANEKGAREKYTPWVEYMNAHYGVSNE